MGESKSTSTLKEMHISRKFYAGEIVDNQVKKFEIVIDKTELYWQNIELLAMYMTRVLKKLSLNSKSLFNIYIT